MAPVLSILILSIVSFALCVPLFIFVVSILRFYVPLIGRGLVYDPTTERWFDVRLNSVWLAFLGILLAKLACFLIPLTMWVTHSKIPPHLRSQTSPPSAMNVYITLAGMAMSLSPIAAIYLFMDHREGRRHGRLANETSVCWDGDKKHLASGFGSALCPWSADGKGPSVPRYIAADVPPEAWSCQVGPDFAMQALDPDALSELRRLCTYSKAMRVMLIFLSLLLTALMISTLLVTFRKERRKQSLAASAAEEAARLPVVQNTGPAP